jgi:hypothetical protein
LKGKDADREEKEREKTKKKERGPRLRENKRTKNNDEAKVGQGAQEPYRLRALMTSCMSR